MPAKHQKSEQIEANDTNYFKLPPPPKSPPRDAKGRLTPEARAWVAATQAIFDSMQAEPEPKPTGRKKP